MLKLFKTDPPIAVLVLTLHDGFGCIDVQKVVEGEGELRELVDVQDAVAIGVRLVEYLPDVCNLVGDEVGSGAKLV